MIKPDFAEWASHLTSTKEIEVALKQAFDQGYYFGLNKGWAIEMDKEISATEEDDPWSWK